MFKNIFKCFKRFILFALIVVVIFLFLYFLTWFFSLEQEDRATIYDPPEITEFRPDHTFITMEESELIEGTMMGRVIVGDHQKPTDEDPWIMFTVFIIPYKHIAKGVQVRLNRLSYHYNNRSYRQDFFILK